MMKKIIMVLMSMFFLFGTVSCDKQASKQASKQAEEEVKQEEEDKGIWIANEDVVDMFPQLKEVREYLLDNYPLTREEQKISKTGDYSNLPIKFYYDDGMEDGEYVKRITTNLFFEKTVTKKQMVEAINYISEKMKEIFSEDDGVEVGIGAFVRYTESGIFKESWLNEMEAFSLEYKRNAPEDIKWKIQTAPYEWIPFDPSTVKEGEKPQYIVENPTEPEQPEQPQEEAPKEDPKPPVTGLGGAKLSELKDYLSSADVEEFNFEEGDGIYTSTGIDPTKTYGYTAVTGSDKETLQGVVYMITRKENLTDDQYLELCEMYLTAGATFGYEGVDTGEATSFIENNMETVLASGESKSQTFGNLSFTITYADNTASLIVLNTNEQ